MGLLDMFFKMNSPEKKFHIGQEVARVDCDKIVYIFNGLEAPAPKLSEIVKVVRYDVFYEGNWYITVSGYKDQYVEKMFAPVISDDDLESELNQIDGLIIRNNIS